MTQGFGLAAFSASVRAYVRRACARASARAGAPLSRDPAPRAPRGSLRGTLLPALGRVPRLPAAASVPGARWAAKEEGESCGRYCVAFTLQPLADPRSRVPVGVGKLCFRTERGACGWGRSRGPASGVDSRPGPAASSLYDLG